VIELTEGGGKRVDRSFPWTETAVVWEHTGNSEFPYTAEVDGHTLAIRVNDFPDEPLYTLVVENNAVEDLEEWPPLWVRPGIPQTLLDMLARSRKPK
jgi:hypothetical protein